MRFLSLYLTLFWLPIQEIFSQGILTIYVSKVVSRYGGEHMHQYYIEVYIYHPYKFAATYIEQASSYGVAINRAFAKFRRMDKLKRKKITQAWATARMS